MTRINLWKAQLKAARSILKIHQKDANAANRTLAKTLNTITKLEEKINAYMAKIKR
jgi:predicted translin family RNA/ssDNA-binding protein